MTDLVRALRAAEASRDTGDAYVRSLQDDIKHRLRDHGVKKIPGIITWSKVAGRTSYDAKAIKAAAVAAGVDVEQFKPTGEASDRLVIQIGSSETDLMPRPGKSQRPDL